MRESTRSGKRFVGLQLDLFPFGRVGLGLVAESWRASAIRASVSAGTGGQLSGVLFAETDQLAPLWSAQWPLSGAEQLPLLRREFFLGESPLLPEPRELLQLADGIHRNR